MRVEGIYRKNLDLMRGFQLSDDGCSLLIIDLQKRKVVFNDCVGFV